MKGVIFGTLLRCTQTVLGNDNIIEYGYNVDSTLGALDHTFEAGHNEGPKVIVSTVEYHLKKRLMTG